MPIVCTTCGHPRGPNEIGPLTHCPMCNTPYTQAAIRDSKPDPVKPEKAAAIEIAWPHSVRVRVTDIDISFSSMVWLFVKASFAAIPAALIIILIWGILAAAIGYRIR